MDAPLFLYPLQKPYSLGKVKALLAKGVIRADGSDPFENEMLFDAACCKSRRTRVHFLVLNCSYLPTLESERLFRSYEDPETVDNINRFSGEQRQSFEHVLWKEEPRIPNGILHSKVCYLSIDYCSESRNRFSKPVS
jgi:hypothetical protein